MPQPPNHGRPPAASPTTKAPAAKPAAGKPSVAPAPATAPARPNALSRLRGAFTTARERNAAAPARGTFRLFFGFLIFMIGAQLLGVVLSIADARLGLKLETQRLAPPNTPVIGGLTAFFVLYLLVTLGFLLLLYRFGIMPRDPFGARARLEATRRQQETASVGSRRTRADRRRDATARDARTTTERPGTPRAAVSGTHDDEYQRVRAAERNRRRRAARR